MRQLNGYKLVFPPVIVYGLNGFADVLLSLQALTSVHPPGMHAIRDTSWQSPAGVSSEAVAVRTPESGLLLSCRLKYKCQLQYECVS